MALSTITSKGQILIPAKIRKNLKISAGTKIYIEEKNDELILRPITPEYLDKIAGILKTKGKLLKALLEERAMDREKENSL
ncbi:MAG: AbrB/MazE/SpoVT family DNA-binding domain-containing protein [Cyanobacteria bacterium]|nr:AbrB/MazE/SpoVT family DNA-binding domain-containing protein [Cyanobacteriota bacterium]